MGGDGEAVLVCPCLKAPRSEEQESFRWPHETQIDVIIIKNIINLTPILAPLIE